MHDYYDQRLVVFVDLLGFRDTVARTEKDRNLFDSIRTILQDFQAEAEKLRPKWDRPSFFDVRLTAFSDSVVISYPATGYPSGTTGPNIASLGTLFSDICFLQQSLLVQGILTRGGIAVGNLYHQDNVVFGSALIDAYQLESKKAKFPRVVLDPRILQSDLAEVEIGDLYFTRRVFTEEDRAIFVDGHFISEDEDGFFFVNYLRFFENIGVAERKQESLETIQRIREIIADCLRDATGLIDVEDKIKWLVPK